LGSLVPLPLQSPFTSTETFVFAPFPFSSLDSAEPLLDAAFTSLVDFLGLTFFFLHCLLL